MLAGLAGLIGGALSMAVGEFISVSSQRDAEAADIQREREEQAKGACLDLAPANHVPCARNAASQSDTLTDASFGKIGCMPIITPCCGLHVIVTSLLIISDSRAVYQLLAVRCFACRRLLL